MDVDAIVAHLWPEMATRVEVLGGGFTNHVFRVDVGGEAYVLRIDGRDTALLGIDRRAEYEASLAAAAVGVGPEVVAFEPEEYLVTRFIEGAVVPVERMGDADALERVASALRAVHRGPSLPSRFNSFRAVEDLRSTAFAQGAEVPPSYVWARQVARRVERARGVFPERPCHNDLINENLIDDGVRIRIIDWEYSAMGDVFYDLANFSMNHDLDRDTRASLLVAYFREERPEDERALELMLFMTAFREAMWGVVQGVVSELDLDFASYVDAQFARLEATAASPAFVAALGDA